MGIKLGKMQRVVDLRSVWPHEEHDFSQWLAKDENLAQLAEAVGIDLELEETESSVGSFSVDIYAKEVGTSRGIIIENQLEDTNHDHLGKIITYAAGKEAQVIIWVVKHARDEHKQAVAWLNQHTDEKIGVFLIEVELWKIGDSLPAPRFNVVERPNEWAKSVKVVESLTPLKRFQLEFWQNFCTFAFKDAEFSKIFKKRKPYATNWYNLSCGVQPLILEFTINVSKGLLTAGIYITNDKDLYHSMQERQADIEQILGATIEWSEADMDCRMLVYRKTSKGIDSKEWDGDYRWFMDKAISLKKVAEMFKSK
ncbi:DUF4268 domain-containing protein [Selenomonas sp. AB3002]|uniref:DUF4268 domain-containing protein n=1 Tax=Selenomonas sp. AB3002 TaxID=1392502 RepID=UPI000496FA52